MTCNVLVVIATAALLIGGPAGFVAALVASGPRPSAESFRELRQQSSELRGKFMDYGLSALFQCETGGDRERHAADFFSTKQDDQADAVSFTTRKPVIWHHLHNVGGTFICEEAKLQGEDAPLSSNCNLPPDGMSDRAGPCTTPSLNEPWGTCLHHCSSRVRLRSIFSFTALERDIHVEDMCSSALLGTMLREPLTQVESTLVMNMFSKLEVLDGLRSAEQARQQGETYTPPTIFQRHLREWDTFQHFDNFATRSLGGAYMAPIRGVTRDHLEEAKRRLSKMDVILILEDLEHHLPQLDHFLSWDTSVIRVDRKKNERCKESAWTTNYLPKLLLESEAAEFRNFSALDYELYDYARELAAARTMAATRAMPLVKDA